MTEHDALHELERLDFPDAMTDAERLHFENLLTLRAYIRGWTGDPLCQPADQVLMAYRQMQSERASPNEYGRPASSRGCRPAT